MGTEVGGGGKTMNTTNTQKKKVLVTGASGLLGVAASEKFLAAGWEVMGVSRRKPELPSGRDVWQPWGLGGEAGARPVPPLGPTYPSPSAGPCSP